MESKTELNMEDEQIHDQLPDVEEYKSSQAFLKQQSRKPDPDGSANTFDYAKNPVPGTVFTIDDVDLEGADLMGSKSQGGDWKCCKRTMWSCIVCLVIASLVVLVLALAGESEKISASAGMMRPSLRYDSVEEYLVTMGVSSADDLRREDSPQHLAAKWIANADGTRMSIPTPSSDINGNSDDWNFIERYVLAVFYFATGGPNWRYQLNFLSPNHVCAWYETFEVENANIDVLDQDTITMGVHGCIRDESTQEQLVPYALFIPNNNLSGTLPDEIAYLRRVVSYDLMFNKGLSGPLPASLGQMPLLRHLGLQYGSITGTIPSAIGDMTDLIFLGLGNNKLTGTIPTDMAKLSKLQLLGLDDNNLTGNLGMLAFLPELRSVYLEDNAFTGELTMAMMVSMPKLQELDVSGNSLVGTLGTDFFDDFNDLRVLDLGSNSFTGTLPGPNLPNFELEYFSVDDNSFTGTIPESIFNFKSAVHLGLSGNNFFGTIPELLGFMSKLEYLFIGQNNFEPGPIPNFLVELSNLRDLSLKDCDLTGTIPQFIGGMTKLELLDLHFNQLTGLIPSILGDLTNMKHLLLKQNRFMGTLPPNFGRLTNLEVLLLEQNNLAGGAEAVCNSDDFNLIYFVSDCDDEFTCDCCSLCCNSDDITCNAGYWNARVDPIWEHGFKRDRYKYDFGPPEETGLLGE